MSIHVMTKVWAESVQSGSALLVLLAIADNANEQGIAWPSEETIAAKARMSERQVRRIIRIIESSGELETVQRRNGRSTNNVYRVTVGSPGQLDLLTGRSPGHPGHSPGHIGSVHPDIAMSAEPSGTVKEPTRESFQDSLGERNDERPRDPVWDALVAVFGEAPRGMERGRWNAAAKSLRADDATPDQIAAAARNYGRLFAGAAMTPTAIAANWTTLTRPARQPSPDEEPALPLLPPGQQF